MKWSNKIWPSAEKRTVARVVGVDDHQLIAHRALDGAAAAQRRACTPITSPLTSSSNAGAESFSASLILVELRREQSCGGRRQAS